MDSNWSRLGGIYSVELEKKLTRLATENGYYLFKVGTQRHFGPPKNWTGPKPERNSEVYVTGIPIDVFEDFLFPIFSVPGPIYKMRIMLNTQGLGRGYLYVEYINPDIAKKAVELLDKYPLDYQKSRLFFSVKIAYENKNLIIFPIPDELNADSLKRLLTENKILGLRYVEKEFFQKTSLLVFKTHKHAFAARYTIMRFNLTIEGKQLMTQWAPPIDNDKLEQRMMFTEGFPARKLWIRDSNQEDEKHNRAQNNRGLVSFTVNESNDHWQNRGDFQMQVPKTLRRKPDSNELFSIGPETLARNVASTSVPSQNFYQEQRYPAESSRQQLPVSLVTEFSSQMPGFITPANVLNRAEQEEPVQDHDLSYLFGKVVNLQESVTDTMKKHDGASSSELEQRLTNAQRDLVQDLAAGCLLSDIFCEQRNVGAQKRSQEEYQTIFNEYSNELQDLFQGYNDTLLTRNMLGNRSDQGQSTSFFGEPKKEENGPKNEKQGWGQNYEVPPLIGNIFNKQGYVSDATIRCDGFPGGQGAEVYGNGFRNIGRVQDEAGSLLRSGFLDKDVSEAIKWPEQFRNTELKKEDHKWEHSHQCRGEASSAPNNSESQINVNHEYKLNDFLLRKIRERDDNEQQDPPQQSPPYLWLNSDCPSCSEWIQDSCNIPQKCSKNYENKPPPKDSYVDVDKWFKELMKKICSGEINFLFNNSENDDFTLGQQNKNHGPQTDPRQPKPDQTKKDTVQPLKQQAQNFEDSEESALKDKHSFKRK